MLPKPQIKDLSGSQSSTEIKQEVQPDPKLLKELQQLKEENNLLKQQIEVVEKMEALNQNQNFRYQLILQLNSIAQQLFDANQISIKAYGLDKTTEVKPTEVKEDETYQI